MKIIYLLVCVIFYSVNCYEIPMRKLEILSPKGFRISIPFDPSISFFKFHGSTSHPLRGFENGDFHGESYSPKNDRFVYENHNEVLKNGHTLYYWIQVMHRNVEYRLVDQNISVPILANDNTINRRFTDLPKKDKNTKNCIRSKTISKGQHRCKGELIFEDHFDVFNFSKWNHEIRMALDTEDGDFILFQDRLENCYVKNGNLHIVPTLLKNLAGYNESSIKTGEINLGVKCTGIVDANIECYRKAATFRILPPVVSARIRTKNTFSFSYGRVEIRAKMPMGDWLFPIIDLVPADSSYGMVGFASGLIRIAYIHGNEILETIDGINIAGNKLFGGVVLSSGAKYRSEWLQSRSFENHLSKEYHVYSMTWTDQSITFAVDGNIYATLHGGFKDIYRTHNITHAQKWQIGEFMAPFDKEFYLTLGVSVGGISDFPNNCKSGYNHYMKPWINADPKCELNFWKNRKNWLPTWIGESTGLAVDYIKVWAL